MDVVSIFVPAALSLASVAAAQASNPLNDFIGQVNSAAAIINSWNEAQSTAGPEQASSLSSAASSAQSALTTAASSIQSAVSASVSSVASSINSDVSSSLASETASNTPSNTASDTGNTASNTPSSTAAPATDNSSGGMDPHTRTIIIAVCVVVGLLLLALIAFLVFCCRRRRRRTRRGGTPLHDEGADWDEHPANPHHSYASSHGVTHNKRLSHGSAMSQRDSAPLMAGAAAGHHSGHHAGHHNRHSIDNSQHPAYRTLDPAAQPGYRSLDPNANNPFTPTPPVRRKPIPINTSANQHHNHSPALAAGVAGAATGAAATHHHDKKNNHSPSPHRSSNPSNSSLEPIQEASPEQARAVPAEIPPERDPNRPPTPFGLGALAGFGNSRKSGEIEPTVADHYHDGPTDDQRRSLHEHERRFSWNPDDDPGSPHSTDNRGSLTTPLIAAPAAAAVAGPAATRNRASSSGAFHDSTYASMTDSSSDESYRSAQMGPQLGGLYDDSERRHSADYYHGLRSYGDRGVSDSARGKRLRFSDEMPLQPGHRYVQDRYGDRPYDGSYDAGRYGSYGRAGGGYEGGVGQAY